MQAYRVEELVIPDPKAPDPVKKIVAVINLDHLITWRPFALYGKPCTILKLLDYNVLHPTTSPHLTWVYIAEDFEAFDAKMMALSTKPVTPPDGGEGPVEPSIGPVLGTQSEDYETATDIQWYEMPEEAAFVHPPCVPPDLEEGVAPNKSTTKTTRAKKKAATKRRK